MITTFPNRATERQMYLNVHVASSCLASSKSKNFGLSPNVPYRVSVDIAYEDHECLVIHHLIFFFPIM